MAPSAATPPTPRMACAPASLSAVATKHKKRARDYLGGLPAKAKENNMREELIATLKECHFPVFEGCSIEVKLSGVLSPKAIEYIADYLIEHGVKM